MPDAGRVIAGRARGIRLSGPRDADTRPLSDRVKESLFAALEAEGAFEGPFLDLFAGTGAGGIEALSRGAPRATFVEHDARTAALVTDNLARTRLSGGTVVRRDALAHLSGGRATEAEPYRAVLVDPPYGQTSLSEALGLLGDERLAWLADDATVVLKHFWRDEPPVEAGSLVRARQRRFGETMLTFYTRPVSAAGQEDG